MQTTLIAGVDEAGRGCLAGPVVAGAVMLPKRFPSKMLKDSKTLSAKQREESYAWIIAHCDFGVGEASHAEIDELGIKAATNLAMQRAVTQLSVLPDSLRVDGRDNFRFDIPNEQFVHGDSLYPEISAAGILAKVTRDRLMHEHAKQFPDFGFERHKGYGVKMHLELIAQRKYCAIHRVTFDPLRTVLTQRQLLA